MADRGPRASTEGGPRSPEELARLHEVVESHLRHHGLRSTEQRRRILEVFFATTSHVSIEELLAEVRHREPGISYATVYRTLRLLAQCGVATEHQFADGLSRYEVADHRGHHDHLICVDCGRIVEFEDPQIEERQRELARRHDFEVLGHKHELYGRCRTCAGAR